MPNPSIAQVPRPADNQPYPEFACGNVFIRPNAWPKGHVVRGHTHTFDHMTLVWEGRIQVRATLPDGRQIDQTFDRGQWCLIRAGVAHEITMLEDGEFWCIYSHRDPQGRVVEHYSGWIAAYA